jgi:hypothetical protein
MKGRRRFLRGAAALGASTITPGLAAISVPVSAGLADRAYWVGIIERLAMPVLTSLAAGRLKGDMPVESVPGQQDERRRYTHLEALGRLLAGMSPWLEIGAGDDHEGKLRLRYAELARKALRAAVDPDSPDALNFCQGHQPVVDAAFLAQALLRAPKELWEKLDGTTRNHLLGALKSTRVIKPPFNNWLLFSAMIEAALCRFGEKWDPVRVDYAIRQHDQWYKGDGLYGDGPSLHWDYYNSFVIQPMLLDVLRAVSPASAEWDSFLPAVLERARRYALILERLISPEGTFPAIGRSLAYRFGAFHLLSQLALLGELPESLPPSQVRSALSAVIRRMVEAPGTFDKNGWLAIGFYGHQPAIGETYISTGSLYLCSVGLLPLGLPPEDPFWSAPPAEWTSRKIWAGQDLPPDHAI